MPGENFEEKKLPVRSGKGHSNIAQRHPDQREQKHALGTETVNNISAGNLHSGVRREKFPW